MSRARMMVVMVLALGVLNGCGGGDEGSDTAAATTGEVVVDTTIAVDTVPVTVGAAVTTTAAVVEATLPAGSSISTAGLGPIGIGASLEAAEAALGTVFVPAVSSGDGECVEYGVPGLDGVGVLVVDDAVAVVEVSTAIVSTPSGVAVGDAASRPVELFGERIETTETAGGIVHTFVPVDDDDQQFRVVFVTDGSVVYRILAGRIPEVTTLQGCAG